MERIGLKEAIGALRIELSESINEAKKEELRFEVDQITLEFQVEIERSFGGSAGIRFWVVDLGAKGSRKSTITHKVKIPLKPISKGGGPILTGDNDIVPE